MAREAMALILCAAACSTAAEQNIAPTTTSGAGVSPLTCPAEVGLPGHEAQFHFQPTRHCGVFVAGIEGTAAVVVGTDIVANGRVYEGTHDCTLAREVRFHINWGDGSEEWTDFLDCDVGRVVQHTYAAAGVYPLSFFAEDRQGLSARCHESDLEVLAEARDLTVSTRDVAIANDRLSFNEQLENYGNLAASNVEVRDVAFDCNQEIVLGTRQVHLAAGEKITIPRMLALPPDITTGWIGVRIDPNDELAEACPEVDLHNNLSVVHTLRFCGELMK